MTEQNQAATWVVGPEHDGALFKKLQVALTTLGYRTGEKSWGIGGSQELATWEVRNPVGSLHIVAETYIGLSVNGPAPLVNELRQCFEQAAD